MPCEVGARREGRADRALDPAHVRFLTDSVLGKILSAVRLVNLRWAGYMFELKLGALLQASFPRPRDASRVRELIEVDVWVDALGVGAHRLDGAQLERPRRRDSRSAPCLPYKNFVAG